MVHGLSLATITGRRLGETPFEILSSLQATDSFRLNNYTGARLELCHCHYASVVFKTDGELAGQLGGTQQTDNDVQIGVEYVRHAADVADRERVGGGARLGVERTTPVAQQFLSALHLHRTPCSTL